MIKSPSDIDNRKLSLKGFPFILTLFLLIFVGCQFDVKVTNLNDNLIANSILIPKPIIVGAPSGSSSSLNLTMIALDNGIAFVKYKYGYFSQTDCSVTDDYSESFLISDTLQINLSSFTDGQIILCALGGLSTGEFQEGKDATSVIWTKDTVAADYTLTNTDPYLSKDNATYTLNGTCEDNGSTIYVTGAATAQATCSNNSWSINIPTVGLPNGALSFNIAIEDSLGNTSSSIAANFETDLCTVMSSNTTYNARGTGATNSPYLICNENQFKDIQASGCNSTASAACSKSFKLMADLDFNGHTLIPIGANTATHKYSGVFDGNSKTLSNIAFTASSNNVGLIAAADGATVKNINIESSTLETNGHSDIAFIVGSAANTIFEAIDVEGDITNSHATTATERVGGVVGELAITGAFNNVIFKGNIGGTSLFVVGGIAGNINGDGIGLDQVVFDGTITATTELYQVGGIAGYAEGSPSPLNLSNIQTQGLIQCNPNVNFKCSQIGGFIGSAQNINLTDGASNIVLEGSKAGTEIGGLFGKVYGVNFSASYYEAEIAFSECQFIGGLAGSIDNSAGNASYDITDSHFIGEINCSGSGPSESTYMLGGIAGQLLGDRTTVSQVYVHATVNALGGAGSSYLGCLIGSSGGGVIASSYSQCSLTVGDNGSYIGGFLGAYVGTGPISDNYVVANFSHGPNLTQHGAFIAEDVAGIAYSNNFYSSTANQMANPSKFVLTSTVGQIESASLPLLVKQNTFVSKAWDFTSTWEIQEGMDYPTLKDQPLVDTYCTSDFHDISSPFANSGDPSADGLTANTAFTICTPAQFISIASNSNYWNKYFILKAHLDFTSITPLAIGNVTTPFTGTLDGNHKTIKSYVFHDTTDDIGLFGITANPAVIKNLRLLDLDIKSRSYVGAITGDTGGAGLTLVENVVISGKIEATNGHAGSIAGAGELGITNVHSYAEVISPTYSGGLVAIIDSVNSYVKKSSFQGTFTIVGTSPYFGGLVADFSDGTIEDSFSTASIVSGGNYVGGLIGEAQGTAGIYRSYSTGSITGNNYVGGIVGYLNIGVSVNDIFTSTGTINGNRYVGGVVGQSSGSILRAYSSRTVLATSSEVGGIVGFNTSAGTLSHSFYVGSQVTGSKSTNNGVGRVIGNYVVGTQTNNYYASTSTCTNLSGGFFCSNIGSSVNTTTTPTYFYNKTNNPFNSGSWNFTTVWKENSSSYPTFQP